MAMTSLPRCLKIVNVTAESAPGAGGVPGQTERCVTHLVF
jgi:hypothetical protein